MPFRIFTLVNFSMENLWAGCDASTAIFSTIFKKAGNAVVQFHRWIRNKFSICVLSCTYYEDKSPVAFFPLPGWTWTQAFLAHTWTSYQLQVPSPWMLTHQLYNSLGCACWNKTTVVLQPQKLTNKTETKPFQDLSDYTQKSPKPMKMYILSAHYNLW